MIRNKSNTFSTDQGINQKRTENFCNNALLTLLQFADLLWLIYLDQLKKY